MDSTVPAKDTLYVSQCLKGLEIYDLKVSLTTEGLHSGEFGGLVADSFRVLNKTLDRIEAPESGRLPEEFYLNMPPEIFSALWKFYQETDLRYGGEKKVSFKDYQRNCWEPSMAVIS